MNNGLTASLALLAASSPALVLAGGILATLPSTPTKSLGLETLQVQPYPATAILSSAVKILANGGQVLGSGTYVGDGFVLTARHVAIEPRPTVNGQSAGVAWVCDHCDMALLLVGKNDGGFREHIPEATLACRLPIWSEEIAYSGFPATIAQQSPQSFFGRIGNPVPFVSADRPEDRDLVQMDIDVWPGASGSGVFNKQGEVLAVATSFEAYQLSPVGGSVQAGTSYGVVTLQACKALERLRP